MNGVRNKKGERGVYSKHFKKKRELKRSRTTVSNAIDCFIELLSVIYDQLTDEFKQIFLIRVQIRFEIL